MLIQTMNSKDEAMRVASSADDGGRGDCEEGERREENAQRDIRLMGHSDCGGNLI